MSRDANRERLTLLKSNLEQELKSDNPGLLYVEDLKFSIECLKTQMQKQEFYMVNANG